MGKKKSLQLGGQVVNSSMSFSPADKLQILTCHFYVEEKHWTENPLAMGKKQLFRNKKHIYKAHFRVSFLLFFRKATPPQEANHLKKRRWFSRVVFPNLLDLWNMYKAFIFCAHIHIKTRGGDILKRWPWPRFRHLWAKVSPVILPEITNSVLVFLTRGILGGVYLYDTNTNKALNERQPSLKIIIHVSIIVEATTHYDS